MPEIEIVQLREEEALEMASIVEIFDEAFTGHRWLDGKSMRNLLGMADLYDDCGCFLARMKPGEWGDWLGLAIIFRPDSPLFPWPVAYWLYGKGRVRDRLCEALVRWAQERDYNEIITANYRLDRSKSFIRLFGRAAKGAKIVGQIAAFQVREKENE